MKPVAQVVTFWLCDSCGYQHPHAEGITRCPICGADRCHNCGKSARFEYWDGHHTNSIIVQTCVEHEVALRNRVRLLFGIATLEPPITGATNQ